MLPGSARALLTLFLLLVGGGYMMALGNLYYQHRLKDNKPELSFDDLRLNFHGGEIATTPTAGMRVAPADASIMLKQILPGGKMRKNLEEGGPPAIRTLETWLADGAKESTFDKTGLVEPDDPSPKNVIEDNCVLCHSPYGDKPDAAFAGDDDVPTYALVIQYAAPGTAAAAASTQPTSAPAANANTRYKPPQSIAHLFLISHVHMLSIPVFTLIVGMLFVFTGLPAAIKTPLAVVPMLALVCDFSCWWLARVWEPAAYGIAAAGAVFGSALAIQILTVLGSMWFGRRPQTNR